MRPKDAEGMAISVDPDQTAPEEQSDLDLHCLLRPTCPDLLRNFYGNMFMCHNVITPAQCVMTARPKNVKVELSSIFNRLPKNHKHLKYLMCQAFNFIINLENLHQEVYLFKLN